MDSPSDFEPDWSDQNGFFDPEDFAETVTLIGCGGIGASVIPLLVTMGIKRFVLWDPDVIEARNIGSQLLYKPTDLYKLKVEVCRDYLLAYGAEEVEVHAEFFTSDSPIDSSIVISAVDKMPVRRSIWPAIRDSAAQLYLDGRIGGEHFELYNVDPIDADWYEKHHLAHPDGVLPCGLRAIVYPAATLAALMCSNIVHWNKGDDLDQFSMGDMSVGRIVHANHDD